MIKIPPLAFILLVAVTALRATPVAVEGFTYVKSRGGTRILHYNVVFNITSHPQDVLDDCKALVGGK